MAVVQIPNLPPVLGLAGNELFEVVQAGTSCKASTQQIANIYSGPSVPPGSVTKYQFMAAIAAYPGVDPNLFFQAIPPDYSDPATIQYYGALFVSPFSPLYNLCQATYPTMNMTTLYGIALAQPVWG